MKIIYLVLICFVSSCNLSDVPPTARGSNDTALKNDTNPIEKDASPDDVTTNNDMGVGDTGLPGKDIGKDINTDGVPPKVLSYSPMPGSVDSPSNTAVSFTVDKELDTTTITPTSFRLSLTGTGTGIRATLDYDSATKTITLVPQVPLTLSQSYTATFTENITDEVGTPIAGASWSFTIGARSWGVPTAVNSDSGYVENPKAAIHIDGNAAVAWSREVGGITSAFVKRYDPIAGWLIEDTRVGTPSLDQFGPNLHFNKLGHLTVAWFQLENATYTPWANHFKTTWGTAVQLDNINMGSLIRLASDNSGDITAVWNGTIGDATHISSSRFNGNVWSPATQITSSSSFYSSGMFFALNGPKKGFVGWTEAGVNIQLFEFEKNQGWTQIPSARPVDRSKGEIAMNAKGDAFLIWTDTVIDAPGSTLWTQEFVNGIWEAPIKRVQNPSSLYSANVALNDNGDVVLIWRTPGIGISASIRRLGGNWSPPTAIGVDNAKNLKMDNSANVFITSFDQGNRSVWRYAQSTSQWTKEVEIVDGGELNLQVSPLGQAIVVWTSGEDIMTQIFE